MTSYIDVSMCDSFITLIYNDIKVKWISSNGVCTSYRRTGTKEVLEHLDLVNGNVRFKVLTSLISTWVLLWELWVGLHSAGPVSLLKVLSSNGVEEIHHKKITVKIQIFEMVQGDNLQTKRHVIRIIISRDTMNYTNVFY